jgi:hypothetical protein
MLYYIVDLYEDKHNHKVYLYCDKRSIGYDIRGYKLLELTYDYNPLFEVEIIYDNGQIEKYFKVCSCYEDVCINAIVIQGLCKVDK